MTMPDFEQTAGILQEIRDDVRAVRSEMTSMLIQVTALTEWRRATEKAEGERDHERRLRKIEESRAWLLGVAAAVGALASLATGLLMRALGK